MYNLENAFCYLYVVLWNVFMLFALMPVVCINNNFCNELHFLFNGKGFIGKAGCMCWMLMS